MPAIEQDMTIVREMSDEERDELFRLLESTFPPQVTGQRGRPLAGSVLRDDDPFGPAMPPEDWEANR